MASYTGSRLNFEGQTKDTPATDASMSKGFLLGLLGMFVIMSYQLHSYPEPVVVMFEFPLAFIRVVWGHTLLGHPMSMPGLLGFVSLAGVLVNDSSQLVQHIRNHVDDGDIVRDSVVKTSRERFRAVFLTPMTTSAGFSLYLKKPARKLKLFNL